VPDWDLSAIRQLLDRAFGSEELQTFCFDHFYPVYENFSGGMSKSQMIRQLVDYCVHHEQIETLVQRIREENPRQYANFAHRLRIESPADDAQADKTRRPAPDDYFDLQIRIQSSAPEAQIYSVEALLGNGSHFEGGMFYLDQDRLTQAESDTQEYGAILFDALFSGPILRAYDQATAYADAQTEKRLRIRLWIDHDAAELHELAWERLHHRVQGAAFPLAASSETPFSRYVGLTTPEPAPIAERPARMLFAISNPTNLPDYGLVSLDVEREITNLIEVLGDLRETRKLQVTLMPGQTGLSEGLRSKLEREGYRIREGCTSTENLIHALSQDGGYHILHYVGHGKFGRKQQQAGLFLEDENGHVEIAADESIAALLKSVGSPLRLVFLAACESARMEYIRPRMEYIRRHVPEDRNPFVGLAPKLVQAGIPAVVAMQDLISVPAARRLTCDLYTYLLDCGVVDRAMNQARLLLFRSGGTEWATPVLFMRLKDGRLFDG
jgi:hypothetical protein